MGSVLIPTWTLGLNIKIHYNFVPRRRVDTTEGIGGGGGGRMSCGRVSEVESIMATTQPGGQGGPTPLLFFSQGEGPGERKAKRCTHFVPRRSPPPLPLTIWHACLNYGFDDDYWRWCFLALLFFHLSLSPSSSSSSQKSVQLVNLGSQR